MTKTAKYCIINSSKNRVVRATSYKNGNCTGFTLSDGGTVRLENTYTVGSTGIMTAAQSGTDSVAYTYDNNRNLLTETINGTLSQINTFNKANQAISVQNKKGTAQQSLFNYTYSENGNMTAAQENLDSVSSRAFTYDGMGRLTAETRDGNTTNYTYDAYSNRAAKNSESYLGDSGDVHYLSTFGRRTEDGKTAVLFLLTKTVTVGTYIICQLLGEELRTVKQLSSFC